jgi:hypothetical protein
MQLGETLYRRTACPGVSCPIGVHPELNQDQGVPFQ